MAVNEVDQNPTRGLFPLSELSERNAKDFGDAPVMRTWSKDGYKVISFKQYDYWVNSIAKWLIEKGIKPNDRVAVLGENRPEWGAAYLAGQRAGAIVVPVDRMMPSSGIRHILSNSGAKILFVSEKMLSQISEMEKIKTIKTIICFDPDQSDVDYYFHDIVREGSELKRGFPVRKMDDVAAILYTSGTTGYSKGVMLTHKNIMSNVEASARVLNLGTGDVFLSVLPIHHAFEATAGFLLPQYCGCSITYARSLKSADLMGDIRATNVTMLVGVPLLFEKMHAGILRGINKKGAKTRILFNGLFNAVVTGEKVNLKLGKKLFKSVRVKAGLDTIKYFVSGGGPLNPATGHFFQRIGIDLLQGYGLTETSPVTHVIRPNDIHMDKVGPPIFGSTHKLININKFGIGEICVKGPNLFPGYYKNEEATAEVIDEEGWFHTGDLGKIHPGEVMQIMGREKNMLVTGGGKNVYPEEVEHYLNSGTYIAEALVVGVPRDSGYGDEVAALIYPDYEQVDIHFEGKRKKPTPDDVFNLIKKEIKELQRELADYKRVRRFRIVEAEFEKTSTRKIKRFLYNGDMLKI